MKMKQIEINTEIADAAPKDYTPYRLVSNLPSAGLTYKGVYSIYYKPYTFGELQVFEQSKLSEIDNINFILSGIFINGFDSKELVYQDFMYIALLRKLSTFKSDKYTLSFVCSTCGESTTTTGEYTNLSFKDINTSAKVPLKILDDEGNELFFEPKTVGDYLKLYEANMLQDKIASIAVMIKNLKFEDAYDVVKNATGDLLRSFGILEGMFTCGLESIEKRCSNPDCKKINIVDLDEPELFIYPFRGYDDLIGDRIFT